MTRSRASDSCVGVNGFRKTMPLPYLLNVPASELSASLEINTKPGCRRRILITDSLG